MYTNLATQRSLSFISAVNRAEVRFRLLPNLDLKCGKKLHGYSSELTASGINSGACFVVDLLRWLLFCPSCPAP